MFKLNAKSDADSLLYSLILNVTATQYTCSLNSSTTPTDYYSEVIIFHACVLQPTLLGCQVTLMLCKLFLL